MMKLPALCLGLVFLASPAFAGDSPPASSKPSASKKEAPPAEQDKGKQKAKTGEACKVDADCDQSGRSRRCVDSKCVGQPLVHPVT